MPDAMTDDLGRRSLKSTLKFFIVLAVLVFVCAGKLAYWQGWLFLAVFFACTMLLTLYFLQHDPALVERRLKVGPAAEKEKSQKLILAVASIVFAGIFVLSGLDYRFGWSHVPVWAVLLGDALVVVGYAIIFVVFRANSFAAATVQIAAGQRVIDTGPYAWVRHPMYAGALFMFAGIPPALGSWWGLLTFAPIVAVLAARLVDEERLLRRELPGYDEYRRNVRYRLVPGVW